MGRRGRSHSQAHSGGWHWRACQGSVAAARGIFPMWRSKGRPARALRAVEGTARRRVDEGSRMWRRSEAAGGRRHARAAGKAEELGDSRRKTEDPAVKCRKLKGLTVKHEQLSHHCSNEDGPKSKNV
jgi:hypothetical protein